MTESWQVAADDPWTDPATSDDPWGELPGEPAPLPMEVLPGEPTDDPEATVEPSRVGLRFLWGHDFLAQPREKRPALLGCDQDCLLPGGGLGIMGGAGGAGKSTLAQDLIRHLASGTDWHGIPVAAPLRIGVIENEGPKEPYIDKLERFAEAWDGPDFLERCAFLDSPWGRFSFADKGLSGELRAFVEDAELDMLVAGPLGRLGIEGVGSPSETRAFLDLLIAIGCNGDLAVLLLHHVNKDRHSSIVQALSGDWAGHPDLILGVEQVRDQRRTRVTFGKVRWGDQGRRPLLLDWLDEAEGIGYRLVGESDAPRVGDENRQRVLDAVNDGLETSAEIATRVGLTTKTVNRHLHALAEAGLVSLREGANRTLIASPVKSDSGWTDPPEEVDSQEALSW